MIPKKEIRFTATKFLVEETLILQIVLKLIELLHYYFGKRSKGQAVATILPLQAYDIMTCV